MTFSYDASLSTDADKVRFHLGQTDSASSIIGDEEIRAVLADETNIYLAAAVIADAIAGRYSLNQNIRIDSFSVDFQGRAEAFRSLAVRLRAQAKTASGGLGSPFVGGVSISEMNSVRDDPDRNPSRFEMETTTFPGNEVSQVDEDDE